MASNYHRHLAPCAGGRHEDAATRLHHLSNLPAHECAKPDQEIQEHAYVRRLAQCCGEGVDKSGTFEIAV